MPWGEAFTPLEPLRKDEGLSAEDIDRIAEAVLAKIIERFPVVAGFAGS